MLDYVHNQGLRCCIRAFKTPSVESLYTDAHEPSLGVKRAKQYLQYASKIKSPDMVFDNKYMKLFDARSNAIRTFGLRIKQFLTASNIDFSEMLETPSYFVLPPWYFKPPKSGASEERSHRCICLSPAFHGNTSQVPCLYSCLYRWFMGGELLLVLHSFHQTP